MILTRSENTRRCGRGRKSGRVAGRTSVPFVHFLPHCYTCSMEGKLAKIYYSPEGYWKGLAAIKKLAEAARYLPEETAKRWLFEFKQGHWQIYLPASKRNSTFHHPTRSTRRTFFLCRTRNYPAGAKFSDRRSPLLMWPAPTKRPNP